MLKKSMYEKIRKLKKKGLSISEILKQTTHCWETVSKYYNMTESDYNIYISSHLERDKKFEEYEDFIIDIYSKNKYEDLTKSSIYDCLLEEYGELPGTERTLVNYINHLINAGKIDIKKGKRKYLPVEDQPFGKQLQIDFGEYRSPNGQKYYIFASVLSASRYKYCSCQSTPFTSLDLVNHLLNCFEYIEGIPKEIVIDQDCTMVSNENSGDFIYTRHFKNFKEEMGFDVYVCRKADPESKGKIEALVKYVKKNFFTPRRFQTVDEANTRLLKWLRRRANGKISYATRQIPQLVFDNKEKKCLMPLKSSIYMREETKNYETRKVNSFSEIKVESRNYSLPEEYIGKEVKILKENNLVIIFDIKSNLEIHRYEKLAIPGSRTRDSERIKQRSKKPESLKKDIITWYKSELWKMFIDENYKTFRRFFRDQYIIAKKNLKDKIDEEILKKSIEYCFFNKTFSFRNLSDTYIFFEKDRERCEPEKPESVTMKKHEYKDITISQRKLSYYESIINQSKNGENNE